MWLELSFFIIVSKLPKNQLLDKIIRVNHAGEYGAKRIYQGQIAFSKNPKMLALLEEMYQNELEHLQFFSEEMKSRKIRPTMLFPLWHMTGYALGAITGMLGEKAAMACTYAVEDVIEDHYEKQLKDLDDDEEHLKDNITKFQSEEVHHKKIAEQYNIDQDLLCNAVNKIVKISSRTAIWLSEKF